MTRYSDLKDVVYYEKGNQKVNNAFLGVFVKLRKAKLASS